MIESFFVVFAIFVAYMVYSIVIQPKKSASEPETVKPERKTRSSTAAKPAASAAKASGEAAKKEPAKAAEEKSQPASVLKNPKTDETANVPNNYRFAKRWIKEALVEEGLLEKIYKNNELDDAASAKVKQAVVELSKMKKYQG